MCFSLLWLCLDIMHCFRGERESILGIKSTLWHSGNWATGTYPVNRDVCEASSFLGFPTLGQVVAALPEPVVRLVSKESEFPHTLPQNQSGHRASSGSFPADTSSHPQHGMSLVAVVIASTPTSPLIPELCLDCSWLDLPVSAWRLLDHSENRCEKTFTQCIIKTVTLCHHPTQVLIILQDNVPASVTTISARSEWSSFLSPVS